MPQSDEWALGSTSPANPPESGTATMGAHQVLEGLLPPGTLAVHMQQMAQIGPQWRAQLRNPNMRQCVNVCAPSKKKHLQ